MDKVQKSINSEFSLFTKYNYNKLNHWEWCDMGRTCGTHKREYGYMRFWGENGEPEYQKRMWKNSIKMNLKEIR
jgi:hypothetical protein